MDPEFEKIKETVNLFCKDGMVLITKFTLPESETDLAIESGELEDLLCAAKTLSIKALYLDEFSSIDENENEKPAMITVGFFFEGRLHKFVKQADWFVEDTDNEETEDTGQ